MVKALRSLVSFSFGVAAFAAALVIGLLSTSVSAQIVRSHSFGVTQSPAAGAWTAICTIEATGVDTKLTYWGDVFIHFSNPNENNTTLVSTTYTVGPTARTFLEDSPGNYRVEAKLTRKGISVAMQATRGALYEQLNNIFYCSTEIIEGVGNVIHAAAGSEQVWGPAQ